MQVQTGLAVGCADTYTHTSKLRQGPHRRLCHHSGGDPRHPGGDGDSVPWSRSGSGHTARAWDTCPKSSSCALAGRPPRDQVPT